MRYSNKHTRVYYWLALESHRKYMHERFPRIIFAYICLLFILLLPVTVCFAKKPSTEGGPEHAGIGTYIRRSR